MNVRRRTMLAALAVGALGGGCHESTAPSDAAPPPLHVVYLDQLFRLHALRVGEAPVRTNVTNVVPFAAANGSVIVADSTGTLARYDLPTGVLTPLALPRPATRLGGALSADGRMLTYTVFDRSGAWVLFVDLASGARDSVDLFVSVEPTILLGAMSTTPLISPAGDRAGFIVRTPLALWFLSAERGTHRLAIAQLDPSVGSFVRPVSGWARWLPNDAMRFLGQLRTGIDESSDTLAVIEVRPFEPDAGARILYRAAPHDSIALTSARGYSFSADGDAVVLALTPDDRDGVFLMRRSSERLEPLVFGEVLGPRYPIVVPDAPLTARR